MRNIKRIVFVVSIVFCFFVGSTTKICAGPVIHGFDIETCINQETGTLLDRNGYDINGFKLRYVPVSCSFDEDEDDEYGVFDPVKAVLLNEDGKYDWNNGYTLKGFNRFGIHKDTGTRFDPYGYDVYGFDRHGIHKETKTKYSPYYFDFRGFRRDGFNVFTGSYRSLF